MIGEPTIRADALTKRYGETTAVRNLDLVIPRGAVYGFLGPNGAGKTTTIEMLTTFTSPTSGQAFIMGDSTADRDAVKRHIGYLPDDPPIYDEFSAREQLEYVADLRQLDPDAAATRIEQLLARVELTSDADARISTYSQGMRQKTGIIQAILHEPEVLVLDEPTNGLDPRAARVVSDLIADLAADGTTVFLSTHILPVVEELADTVGVLHHGELVTEGPPTELTQQVEQGAEHTLEEVFLEVTTDDEPMRAEAER
jgi:ABC-2 type transport system ATP-binding protein